MPSLRLARASASLILSASGILLTSGVAVGQNPSEVQVAPAQVTLKVGQRQTLSATVYDAAGNILTGQFIRWTSANLAVARVEYDSTQSSVATVIGTGVGVTLLEARAGNVPGSAAVQVEAAEVLPQAVAPPVVTPAVVTPPAPLPDTVMAPGVADVTQRSIARLDVYRYGSPAACGNGVVVGDGLVLTSYGTIVGADSVVVELSGGRRLSNPAIASYDASADAAVLKVSATTADSVVPTTDAAANSVVWLAGAPNCGTPRTLRSRIASRDAGVLHVANDLSGFQGGALINQHGQLVGFARSGRDAGLGAAAEDQINAGRRAAAMGQTLAVSQVSRRENQLYGSLLLHADVTGASAHVVPMERWQKADLEHQAALPFTFTGPMGRYRVDLLVDGTVRSTSTLTVQPGIAFPSLLVPAPVLATQPQAAPQPAEPPPGSQVPAASGGGGFPWPLLLVVGAGGGAAAYFLTKKSGTGTGPTGTTGTIVIHIPNQ